jgi:hypothetical protein
LRQVPADSVRLIPCSLVSAPYHSLVNHRDVERRLETQSIDLTGPTPR